MYEADFIADSHGFRPGRGCHDALRALSVTVESGGVHFIVEADIRGFFDNVEHEWLMKFLGHRIGDKRVLRYVKRFLKAGVFDLGEIAATEQGTPQGGVISPLLANIYLHYSLDLWYTRVFSRTCACRSRLIRYADDCVPRRQALTSASHAAQKMREGPSKPPCRWRLQTTVSCVG